MSTMRLKLCNPSDAAAASGASAASARHSSLATGVVWTKPYETVSCGDDQCLRKWTSMQGQQATSQGKLFEAGPGNYCTCMDYPSTAAANSGAGAGGAGGRSAAAGGADSAAFAVGFSDGSVVLVGKNGREEKRITGAHRGGITCIKWSYEGTAFATTGEDGACKIFSRSGMLRTTLAQFSKPIYSCSWSADSEELIMCCEKSLHFKSVQPGAQKQQSWKAHDGILLQCDWCPVNNLILSCGEDCRYKVWDPYGRLLFASTAIEHVITSVSWAPNGKTFAVGAFNLLKLCDRSGWSSCCETPNVGSLFQITWCPDGTCLAAASGSGDIIFGTTIGRTVSYTTMDASHATLENNNDTLNMNTLVVRENAADNSFVEELDFRDAIIDFSLHQKALVVVTNYQVFVYSLQQGALNTTPQVEDLKEPPMLIVQSLDRFCLVDSNGLNIYTYEGRLLTTVRYSGMRVELLNDKTVSLAKDLIAITDFSGNGTSSNVVRIFDVHSGRQLQELEHKRDILKATLNHAASKVALLDKNKDLFLCPSHKVEFQKLGSMVEDFQWNEDTDMMVTLSDQKLDCYLYPNVVFVEATLLPLTVTSKPCLDAGPYAQLSSFTGAHVLCRKADGSNLAMMVSVLCRKAGGSNLAMMVSPFPLLLYRFFEKGQWDLAIRLCRYVKMSELWACLAGMAIFVRELNTVEIALAAAEEIDKVQFVAHINSLPDDTLKTSELALFCKRPEEALGVLLANKRVFRAIKLCLRTHRWEQALDLAVQHQTHVDTVLAYRDRHLKLMRHSETNAKFKQWSAEVTYDWPTVQQKIAMEKERELQGAQGN